MPVESPCTDVCAVDDGICTGCGRTVEEITSWSQLSEAEKRAVLEEIEDRAYPTTENGQQ
jgi:predicted Fe-S protein YdhL (DUF1289 family)